MPDDRVHDEPYEPPRIEERAEIDIPLIGAATSASVCSVFTH
jgi:hypothetical protein